MRLSRPLCLCLSLLLSLSALPLPAAEPLTEKQIARVESLCRVWGTVKFFHPWIVAPPDGKTIDWDAALIETIPLVEKATSAEDFAAALNRMLASLSDDVTEAKIAGNAFARQMPRASPPAPPPTKTIESGGKKALVIEARNWSSLAAYERKTPGTLFTPALTEAANADVIIFDLRLEVSSPIERQAFADALKKTAEELIKSNLVLAAKRSRYHSGYAPEMGLTSGGYHSGFLTDEAATVVAKPGPNAGKPLIFFTNADTDMVISLIAALQATGQATVLHHANRPRVFAPGSTTPILAADEVLVTLRTSDQINADGTFGLTPDLVFEKDKDENGDTLLTAASAIIRGELKPPVRSPKRLPSIAVRTVEKTYPDMISPNREYRLLGLFRVWNVMHYFFPYKQHMDRTWDSVLTEYIPRFSAAEGRADYGNLAQEFVAHLQDSHVRAYGGAAQVGANIGIPPLVLLRPVQGQMVVSRVHESLLERVKIGDVVTAVDGEDIGARMARMKKYIAASTPQALERRLANDVLRGRPPMTTLKLQSNDVVREETLPRLVGQPLVDGLKALNEANQRKTRPFAIVQGYGYFDLPRLTLQQVTAAFNMVRDTPALIMDMRGYPQGTAWAISPRLTNNPFTTASFRRHYWTSPNSAEERITFDQRMPPSPLWKYTGKIVVLINENAISQAEHSCLGFEEAAKGRITFIGTPTMGANGDVTNTSMPSGIRISFSGHDVRHADGRQLQRLGIQPDIRVEPTIEGLVADKDEVLEAAIKFLDDAKLK